MQRAWLRWAVDSPFVESVPHWTSYSVAFLPSAIMFVLMYHIRDDIGWLRKAGAALGHKTVVVVFCTCMCMRMCM